jgi:hypothetical protein
MGTDATMDAATLPGYRRAVRVEPQAGAVTALLEDDLHCMAVRLRHDGSTVRSVEAFGDRMPWTTCPGAVAELEGTFAGVPLAQVTARREKQRNCTHLHDLAVLAAAHAGDRASLEYRVEISDPRDGERILQIARDGRPVHRWVERDGLFTDPPGLAGQSPLTMRDWIGGLSGTEQEAARMLQWTALVAHGRQMTDERRHAALGHRPSCYTMQPERAGEAEQLNPIRDFTGREERLLDGLKERFEAASIRSS